MAAAIPVGSTGRAVGDAAALKMTTLRDGDGSAPPLTYSPGSVQPGDWQLTPGCTAGVNFHWQNITPFGVESAGAPGDKAWIEQFRLAPPPELSSKRVCERLQRSEAGWRRRRAPRVRGIAPIVATFYAASSPS